MLSVHLPVHPSHTSSFLPAPYSINTSTDAHLVHDLLSQALKEITEIRALAPFFDQNITAIHAFADFCELPSCGTGSRLGDALARMSKKFWLALLDKAEFMLMLPVSDAKKYRALPEKDVPLFVEEQVLPTIQSWILDQDVYFARRVHEIFTELSKAHVTNDAFGFGPKMIFFRTRNFPSHLDQLRAVLAAMSGEISRIDAYKYVRSGSEYLLDGIGRQYARGEKGVHVIDDGRLSLRVYSETVHVMIDPEFVAGLNDILSMLSGGQLPETCRPSRKKTAQSKTATHTIAVPFKIRHQLLKAIDHGTFDSWGEHHYLGSKDFEYDDSFSRKFAAGSLFISLGDAHEYQSNFNVWESIRLMMGAEHLHVKLSSEANNIHWQLPINSTMKERLKQVVSMMHSIPEYQEFQFYPTPEYGDLAEKLKDVHQMFVAKKQHSATSRGLRYLEPSFGSGALYRLLDLKTHASHFTAVELSPFLVSLADVMVVKSDRRLIQGDFLEVSKSLGLYDMIVMNPPFSGRQAVSHVESAVKLLDSKGVLIAILPASLHKQMQSRGDCVYCSNVFTNQFERTGCHVFIVALERQ